MTEKITEENVGTAIWDAVAKKDEKKLKESIIVAMKLFLRDKLSKDDLDTYASDYMTVPIHEKEVENIDFEDTKLRYVLEELSAIEIVPDKRAKENVKRFILYLEGKDYEKI